MRPPDRRTSPQGLAGPVQQDAIYGCWRWTGDRDRDGYGRIGRRLAHRALWELAHDEPLEREQELDHLCRRRDCVRPSHLEAVTRSQNELRKSWRVRARRQTCPAGHKLFQHGRRTPEGGFACRTCDAEQLFRDSMALEQAFGD